MRRDESKAVREAIEYQPSEKIPRDRPRKRCKLGFKNTGCKDWKDVIQDRGR